MKKTLVSLAGATILLSGSVAMANPVQIITSEFYSVGNAYDAAGINQGNFNPASQDLGVNTYQTPDGEFDSFDIGTLLRIRDLSTGLDLFTQSATKGLSFVVSGIDDVLFNPIGSGTDSFLYSLGINVKLYADTPPDFDPTNPATASNGTLLLDLDGVVQTLPGTNPPGFDLTNGNQYDLVELYNFGSNTYQGSSLLEVVGGTWAPLWDTNTQNLGADLTFSFSLDDVGGVGEFSLSGTANGIGAAVPEPATMLLFGTGLIGLAGLSRRKKRK